MTRDAVVRLVELGVTLVLALAAVADNAANPVCAIGAGLWVSALAWRSAAPAVMAVVVGLGMLVYALAPHPLDRQPFLASLLVLFSVGSELGGRRRLWASGLLLVAAAVMQVRTTHLGPVTTALSPVLLVVAPVLAGALLRRSREQSASLRRLGEELAREREARARAAAAEERNRIARELHDVISHSVSVMVVQAGAAEQQLPPGSPAREQVLAVRRTGKEALAELRRQLGVLRDEWGAAGVGR